MEEKLATNVENRGEQAEKVIEFLSRSGIYEYVEKLTNKKELDNLPDFEIFKDFLIRLNGLIRDIPIAERDFDGETVHLSGAMGYVLMPKHEDKKELLRHAFDSLQKVDQEDVAYLLPAVINALHLFNDGNGRTSRIFHLLLRKYPDKETFLGEARNALGESGRYNSFDINPGLIDIDIESAVLKIHGWELKSDGKLDLSGHFMVAAVEDRFDEKHPFLDSAKQLLNIRRADSLYLREAIEEALGERVNKVITEYGKRKMISPYKMLGILSGEDWEKIFENYYQLKREHINTLVDIFVSPKHYRSIPEPSKTVKDYFVQKITDEHQKLNP